MVRYLHAIIRQALQQAVKEGLLPRNVADATSPPTVKNKQMRPLTEEELLTFSMRLEMIGFMLLTSWRQQPAFGVVNY